MLSPQDTGVRRLLIILVAVIVLFSILQPEVFDTRLYCYYALFVPGVWHSCIGHDAMHD